MFSNNLVLLMGPASSGKSSLVARIQANAERVRAVLSEPDAFWRKVVHVEDIDVYGAKLGMTRAQLLQEAAFGKRAEVQWSVGWEVAAGRFENASLGVLAVHPSKVDPFILRTFANVDVVVLRPSSVQLCAAERSGIRSGARNVVKYEDASTADEALFTKTDRALEHLKTVCSERGIRLTMRVLVPGASYAGYNRFVRQLSHHWLLRNGRQLASLRKALLRLDDKQRDRDEVVIEVLNRFPLVLASNSVRPEVGTDWSLGPVYLNAKVG